MFLLPNKDDKDKLQKNNKISALIDKTNKMDANTNNVKYEDESKLLKSKNIDDLHVFLPNPKQERSYLKHHYIEDVLEKIKHIKLTRFGNKQTQENINQRFLTDNDKRILKNEINKWLADNSSNFSDTYNNLWSNKLTDLVIHKLNQLLDEPKFNKNYNKTLQEEIYNIIKEIPFFLNHSTNRKDFIANMAEDLAINLLTNLKNDMHSKQFSCKDIQRTAFKKYTEKSFNFSNRSQEINDRLCENQSYYSSNVIQKISQCDHGKLRMSNKHFENDYIDNQNKLVFQLTRNTMEHMKSSNEENLSNEILPVKFTKSHPPYTMSIYMAEDLIKYPFTSTPKKPTIPKDAIPRLNAGEIVYMKSLADVIREWMKTLPIQLDDTESVQFKEVIINDLAGNIVYEVKKKQLAPSDDLAGEIKSLILLWLDKFTIYNSPDDKDVAVDRLYMEFLKIPVPSLIQPQHGTRKKMKSIKFREVESDLLLEYIPEGIDIIEDEISMWMNEQPEKIYIYDDRISRNNMIHKLAEIVQQHLLGEHIEKEIEKDVAQWLHEMIKPDEKEYIDQMIEELRDRVKKLPQEATLRREYKERLEIMKLSKLAKENAKYDDSSTFCNDYNDPNETMKQFLEKFIQHNYDVDDSLARNAFGYILKKELVRINPPTRKEIYENFAKSEPNDLFAREKFVHELEYIKIISDWFKKLPIIPPCNQLKNKHRIYFIHNLAKYITEIEEEIAKAPDAMNYDLYMYSIIRAYMATLPILTDNTEHIKRMNALNIDLVNIIINHRYNIQNKHANLDGNPNNLEDFIDEFIHEHGKDLKDDPLKLEVWMDRLMIELQKLVRNTSDPAILGRTQLYKRLAEIPIPEEESIELFNTKLIYIKEITDWLKNLPIRDICNQSDNNMLVKMITELSERMIDRRMMKLNNPNNAQDDTNFVEFLKQWIFALPLDTRQEIIMPIIIQQLMNRIDRVNKSNEPKTDTQLLSTNKPQVTDESNKPHEKNISKIYPNKVTIDHKSPENAIIHAVEKFCNALPLQANTESEIKVRKDEIGNKLLQKISQLNIDPIVFNDEHLFKEILKDEVDMVLESILQDFELQNNKENFKNTLINSIVEVQNVIKEQSAGQNYKQNLENTIEASIPNPIQINQIYDPGFEFYKNRLATMFIMENFDHADEDVKIKYEKRIQSEVDKYFEYAQNRNAIPLNKDQIQNELYSALFKVPIPNEASIAGEVEESKTRFEIDAWYELLPLLPARTLDELLERDKILSTLAKRIHEIERVENPADMKIHKEINKWLTKLPLLPGNEKNIVKFADYLLNRLKSTSDDRKCVLKDNYYIEKNKGKNKVKRKSDKTLNENVDNVVHEPPPSQKLQIYNHMLLVPQKPAADLILEAVQSWCNALPILVSTPTQAATARNIKDNLVIKIILKISEINSDPVVFDDEYEYDAMLDQEIDKLTYNLPILCDYHDKEARKCLLKEKIRSFKPIIVMERNKQEYKEELEQTVSSFLEESNESAKSEPPKELIEKIVDDFIEYYYNKEDVEERNVHKNKVHNSVVKHLSYIKDKLGKELAIDPLIIRNELICKLSKVAAPSKVALQNIILEIRMKKEVDCLFEELSLYKQDKLDMDMIKITRQNLTKKLCQLEITGHNPTNQDRISKEVSKCLRKLKIDVDPVIINTFVDRLRNNEMVRKTPPRIKTCTHYYHRNTVQVNNEPQISPPTAIPNQGSAQLISGSVLSVPKVAEARVTRREMVIPRREIPRSQVKARDSIEISDDNKICKCTERKTRKRKRVCIAGRNFGYNYVFRRPMIPMWCRFPRFGF